MPIMIHKWSIEIVVAWCDFWTIRNFRPFSPFRSVFGRLRGPICRTFLLGNSWRYSLVESCNIWGLSSGRNSARKGEKGPGRVIHAKYNSLDAKILHKSPAKSCKLGLGINPSYMLSFLPIYTQTTWKLENYKNNGFSSQLFDYTPMTEWQICIRTHSGYYWETRTWMQRCPYGEGKITTFKWKEYIPTRN